VERYDRKLEVTGKGISGFLVKRPEPMLPVDYLERL
jgi:hypothetical protein